MQASAQAEHSTAPRHLAQAGLPRRAQALAEGVFRLATDELQRWLAATLDEFELTLFRLAEGARNFELQQRYASVLDEVRRTRNQVAPRFIAELEASIAGLRLSPTTQSPAPSKPQSQTLSLVEDVEIEEDITLKEAATRAEMRCGMPLFLLGQRFGVLASRPAFDVEHLPVGPPALCRMLRLAADGMRLDSEHRVLLFRQFERHMSMFAGQLYDSVNGYLIAEGVLSHMTFVPVRVKRGPAPAKSGSARPAPSEAQEAKPAAAPDGGRPSATVADSGDGRRAATAADSGNGKPAATEALPAGRPPTPARPAASGARPSYDDAPTPVVRRAANITGLNAAIAKDIDSSMGDEEFFNTLRRLMDGKRSLLGKLGAIPRSAAAGKTQTVAEPKAVQNALGRLQQTSAPTVRTGDRSVVRSISHVKQDLMAELRQSAGAAAALRQEDNDTIDLVGMLFDQVMKDVRPNSAAASLLAKLQVPLLRVALEDRGFFSQSEHPARQMLNAVAEATFHLSADDEVDRDLASKMGMVVERVGKEFDGDLGLLERLASDIGQQVQAQTRKAEIAERRHVEAARGKEKLETARLHAAEAIDARLSGKRVPKFLRTLLDQTWSDVLALSALRGGENSEGYRHQLQIADRLIDSAVALRTTGAGLIGLAEGQTLREEIEHALSQVGYHGDDARAVASRLLATSVDDDDEDPASRTELALKLKQRARFGQSNVPGGTAPGVPLRSEQLPPEERQQLDTLKRLPFGTWFEMAVPERKEPVRRRMAWFSPVTGNCLLVNHRGQRVGEYSLIWLAREMVAGRASILVENTSSFVDRAWKAILNTLHSFGGGDPQPEPAP